MRRGQLLRLNRDTSGLPMPRNLPGILQRDDYFMRLFNESKSLDITRERFRGIMKEMRQRWSELIGN